MNTPSIHPALQAAFPVAHAWIAANAPAAIPTMTGASCLWEFVHPALGHASLEIAHVSEPPFRGACLTLSVALGLPEPKTAEDFRSLLTVAAFLPPGVCLCDIGTSTRHTEPGLLIRLDLATPPAAATIDALVARLVAAKHDLENDEA